MGKLGFGIFGCYLNEDDIHTAILIDIFARQFWILLSLSYLAFVTILVILKLRTNIKTLQLVDRYQQNEATEQEVQIIRRLIYRV